ncbi:succinate dehydrogenase subunit 5, mitochondrial-like [Dendrobium catenatum]|uniref:succinate dehydrogenase subunit 5, mitochondrial-like n=1 Tax=Dendrobium catenatum TaxID=906689 RepID=UPI0010A08C26|nr:succinate dehydrogenase subunit 5, mitochondrial-like [Dendrobium catenatum]
MYRKSGQQPMEDTKLRQQFPVPCKSGQPWSWLEFLDSTQVLSRDLGCYLPFGASFKRDFSATAASQLPAITDPDIKVAFKDLMALNWNEVPDSLVNETTKALSKTTDDVSGEEALANAFRAAEASVEFGSTLVSLRMALDDLGGLTGENVGNLPDGLDDAIEAAYRRYKTYLDSFGPDEVYLRKKVEIELGTKMIHIKMRCSGIGSEWGKVIQFMHIW